MAQNVLSQEDLERIKQGLENTENAGDIITLAKQAGMDVSTFEQRNNENKARLLKLKNTFFPGQ